MKNRISIGYLGNIDYDTRTYNMFQSLKNRGYHVIFNGFDWMTPYFRTIRTPEINITRLVKNKISVLFYIKFALILFCQLFKQNASIYFASDIYALPVCIIIARLKGVKVFFDSREIYSEITGIQGKYLVKKLMKILERCCIYLTDLIFTTGEMDSAFLKNKYQITHSVVLRNLPLKKNYKRSIDFRKKFGIPEDHRILLYQGIIMHGRGLGLIMEVLKKYSKIHFIILGWGEFKADYKKIAMNLGVQHRVHFVERIIQSELLDYTSGADIGLCMIENVSFNNYYALPNKLFEYIMAGIPVICSNLPQICNIVEQYRVGEIVDESDINGVVQILHRWQKNPLLYNQLKKNCYQASQELNWEREFTKIVHYFN